ncbi:MAG TPA: glucans biosynthesis glucosyltransferase MdoH, partial [Pseudomonadales bacterium]|nr:glucans biosynthesis glucosyltransferase MdoH [Pseudomonadales bacterium]
MSSSRRSWVWPARIRRFVLTVLVFGQVYVGTRYMLFVLPYHGGDLLEISLAVLFAILFTWISIGFWLGLYGFFLRRFGGDRLSLLRKHGAKLADVKMARTAIIMPIYNEPIERTLGGLRAVYRA